MNNSLEKKGNPDEKKRNPILKKKVFRIQVTLISPLSISSGREGETDSDVICDYDGRPFVPASSLAGAMRAYLKKDKDEPCLMGYSKDDENGKMSALFLSDMIFDDIPDTSVRDGVELNEKKTTVEGSKFDMEIIEAGTRATFYAEITIREDDTGIDTETNKPYDREAEYDRDIAAIIKGLNSGEIRLGSKKTRGFGRFKVDCINCREFDKSNYIEYAKVYRDKMIDENQEQNDRKHENQNKINLEGQGSERRKKENHDCAGDVWIDCMNLLEDEKWIALPDKEKHYFHLDVPLRLKGGISIRQYASRIDEPDFVHITNKDGKAVIPGSSFAGAIRHRLKDILTELKGQESKIDVKAVLDDMFGYVEKEMAHVSAVVISESEIEGAEALTMTRTGISRFESAARDKALFTEKTYVGGTLTLNILIEKDGQDNPGKEKRTLGLILLAVEDIRNGYLAVGGGTAVGRGIFEANGNVRLDEKELNIKDVNEAIGEAFLPFTGGVNI